MRHNGNATRRFSYSLIPADRNWTAQQDRAADTPAMTSCRTRCNWSRLRGDNPLYHPERREFSRTEGSSRGTHGVICDQGPESRWVRSLKSAWRITALRAHYACAMAVRAWARTLSPGAIWKTHPGQPPWARMRWA